jgi:hypothetical protein
MDIRLTGAGVVGGAMAGAIGITLTVGTDTVGITRIRGATASRMGMAASADTAAWLAAASMAVVVMAAVTAAE